MELIKNKSHVKSLSKANERRRQHRLENLEIYRQKEKERYEKSKKVILERQKQYYQKPEIHERRRLANKKYRLSEHGKRIRNENARQQRKFWRNKLFDVLGGPKCIMCGYDKDHRALQFDHINGQGRKHRQTFRSMSARYYKIHAENPNLAKQVFQVLCACCNQIKKFDKKEM